MRITKKFLEDFQSRINGKEAILGIIKHYIEHEDEIIEDARIKTVEDVIKVIEEDIHCDKIMLSFYQQH